MHLSSTTLVKDKLQKFYTVQQRRWIRSIVENEKEKLSNATIFHCVSVDIQRVSVDLEFCSIPSVQNSRFSLARDCEWFSWDFRLDNFSAILHDIRAGTAVFPAYVETYFIDSSKPSNFYLKYGIFNRSKIESMTLRLTTERIISAMEIFGNIENGIWSRIVGTKRGK